MPYVQTGNRYIKTGDVVEVHNTDHSPALICRRADGVLFPIRAENLTDEFVEPIPAVIKQRVKPEIKKPLTQAEKLQLEYLNNKK